MAAEKQPETTAPQVEKPPTGEPAPNTKPALGEDDEFEDFPSEGTLPTPSPRPPFPPSPSSQPDYGHDGCGIQRAYHTGEQRWRRDGRE